MTRPVWAVVPAAGRGRRFGGDMPKQYLPLAGRPLIAHTLDALLADPRVAGVVVAIADRIGAVLVLGRADEAMPRTLAVQRVGKVSASLGEVKNRADVVVFWGSDPVVTHPRHFERYSVDPPGRFVPRGRAERTLMVADLERTATAASILTGSGLIKMTRVISKCERAWRASHAIGSAPAQRRARARVGESEGRSPSDNIRIGAWLPVRPAAQADRRASIDACC